MQPLTLWRRVLYIRVLYVGKPLINVINFNPWMNVLHCLKSNPNFCDITWNVDENQILLYIKYSAYSSITLHTFYVLSRKIAYCGDGKAGIRIPPLYRVALITAGFTVYYVTLQSIVIKCCRSGLSVFRIWMRSRILPIETTNCLQFKNMRFVL